MSPISWIFRGCKKLMAKAVTKSICIGANVGRRGDMYKVFPVSETLARFVGEDKISFSTAIRIVLNYIDDHNLVNLENTEEVFCDYKLKTIFDGKDTVVGLREIEELLMRHFPIRKKMSSKVAPTNAGKVRIFDDTEEVSEPLASFLSENKVTRITAMREVWMYIDAHDLWEEAFTWKTETWIRCDEKLKTIFDGKDKIAINEFLPLLMRHFPDGKVNN